MASADKKPEPVTRLFEPVQPERPRPLCAIAFFGIDRRLDLTAASIFKNIVEPAEALFEVKSVGHLWRIQRINNQRSGEFGSFPSPRVSLLPAGEYRIEPPLDLPTIRELQELCRFGDFWQDEFTSLSNLYSQLVSLCRATEMALQLRPSCVIFVRPDLAYHDSLRRALKVAVAAERELILLPHWQPHGGLNDRFAICCGDRAIRAYGMRLKSARNFCQSTGGALHSERLVRFAIAKAGVQVRTIQARASRVRLDGRVHPEDFSRHGWKISLRERLSRFRRNLRL